MLERNATIKAKPEKFQTAQKNFEIVVTFEERVMDIVVEGYATMENPHCL